LRMARKIDQPLTLAQAKARLRETASRSCRVAPGPTELLLAVAAGWLVGRRDPLAEPLTRILTCVMLAGGWPREQRQLVEHRAQWPPRIRDS
jgi:hypothetical protein